MHFTCLQVKTCTLHQTMEAHRHMFVVCMWFAYVFVFIFNCLFILFIIFSHPHFIHKAPGHVAKKKTNNYKSHRRVTNIKGQTFFKKI